MVGGTVDGIHEENSDKYLKFPVSYAREIVEANFKDNDKIIPEEIPSDYYRMN